MNNNLNLDNNEIDIILKLLNKQFTINVKNIKDKQIYGAIIKKLLVIKICNLMES